VSGPGGYEPQSEKPLMDLRLPIEKESLVALFKLGCIPTKALLKSAVQVSNICYMQPIMRLKLKVWDKDFDRCWSKESTMLRWH